MKRWRPRALLTDLEVLRRTVGEFVLPLDVAGVAEARHERAALVGQLDDYLLPRLRSLDAPLLAVVGGSTGAGKSTLVNSLLRQPLSRSGVLRPTTRSPLLVHHPDDAGWFNGDRVLPTLARVTGAAPPAKANAARANAAGAKSKSAKGVVSRKAGTKTAERVTELELAACDTLPAGLALLDAPDVDSVVESNRELAQQVLAAADLWIFVTTAARYADAVPWNLLHGAAERGATVAVVMDRVPPEAMDDVRLHLAGMLSERGLAAAPLFTVAEQPLDDDGLLSLRAVQPLTAWLVALAGDAQARQVVMRRTLTGAIGSVQRRVLALGEAAAAQDEARRALAEAVTDNYATAASRVDAGMSDGSLLRGEVLARWQEFVGTGEFFRALEVRVSRLRDRLSAAARGRPAPTERIGEALQTGVEVLLITQVRAAARGTAQQWRSASGGGELVGRHPELAETLPGLEDRVARIVRDWQSGLLEMVSHEGGDRRTTARVLSYGVNGLGVLLMLVVFGQTAGLSGAEVGIAGGTALVAQRLLEAIFGDQAVRSLAAKAQKDLARRSEELLAADRRRYEDVLDGLGRGVDRSTLERVATALGRA
jgi:hypothetical protein